MSHRNTPVLPALSGALNLRDIQDTLAPLHAQNRYSGFGVCQSAWPVLPQYSYAGGIYSPTQNRVYLVPYYNATASSWHYVDCNSGTVVSYAHGQGGLSNAAYIGGTYHPALDRIYFAPLYQFQPSYPNGHYIDCRTGLVGTYANPYYPPSAAYWGAAYLPTLGRLYFIPFQIWNNSSYYHYIDGSGNCVQYALAVTLNSYAYVGGAYSPTQDKFYLAPYGQANTDTWHYMDGKTGALGTYAGDATATQYAYIGAAYSPMDDRVYFIPSTQSTVSKWHYVDCRTGTLGSYTPTMTPPSTSYGGAYSPATNRIYFSPYAYANSGTWYYMDCTTGSVVSFASGVSPVANAYICPFYSPTEGRIYLSPFGQATQTNWHWIQEHAPAEVPPHLAALPLFNKS